MSDIKNSLVWRFGQVNSFWKSQEKLVYQSIQNRIKSVSLLLVYLTTNNTIYFIIDELFS